MLGRQDKEPRLPQFIKWFQTSLAAAVQARRGQGRRRPSPPSSSLFLDRNRYHQLQPKSRSGGGARYRSLLLLLFCPLIISHGRWPHRELRRRYSRTSSQFRSSCATTPNLQLFLAGGINSHHQLIWGRGPRETAKDDPTHSKCREPFRSGRRGGEDQPTHRNCGDEE